MSLFPPDIIAAAQSSQAKWKIPAALTLAQWAVESGYGAATPPGSNNPFGIKALPGQPAVLSPTSEDPSGSNRITGKQPFRKYASIADAFDDHGRLLGLGAPYREMVTDFLRSQRGIDDVNRLANALTGVYAVARNYGSTLINVMKQYNLYQYDQETAMATKNDVPAQPEVVSKTASAPVTASSHPAVVQQTPAAVANSTGPLPTIGQAPLAGLNTALTSLAAFVESLKPQVEADADKLQAAALASVPFGSLLNTWFPHVLSQVGDNVVDAVAAFAKTTGTTLSMADVPTLVTMTIEKAEQSLTWLSTFGINVGSWASYLESYFVAKIEGLFKGA